MPAVTWHGRRAVRAHAVPDPTIPEPADAIPGIPSTGLGGSCLHLYVIPFAPSEGHCRP